MPLRAPAPLSRRQFVATAAGLASLAVAGGCAVPLPDRAPDPLLRLAQTAARDAREFAVANETHGASAGALRQLATTRRIHFERLTDEVDRAARDSLFGSSETNDTGEVNAGGSVSGPDNSTAGEVHCPPFDQVLDRLRADAISAADFAVSAEGYRAELAAAVSASCTAAREVVLA